MTTNKKLLIVDDDQILCDRLGKAMSKRGYDVTTCYMIEDAVSKIPALSPNFAVIDLRLSDGNGLKVVEHIKQHAPDCRVIMLTAYGNFASAVSAVKAGAIDYLAKPADADAIEQALLQTKDIIAPPLTTPMTADRVKWEHILRVFEQCDGNVSETARQLKMHRRTLQRILAKHAPHN